MAGVAKLIAYYVAKGLRPCSAETGANCLARDKLDENALGHLVTCVGREVEDPRARAAVAGIPGVHRRRNDDHDIVGNRPDRSERPVVKRRPKQYKLMQKPRSHYKPGEA